MLRMAIESLVKEYLKIEKLSKVDGAAELVLDAILTHFGYDDCDLKEGVEKLYTMGKIKHSFRSVLNKGEDMPAILGWFKEKTGLTDEAIAAEVAKVAAYAASMLGLGKEYAAMGHSISSKKYFELAAGAGSEEAKGILANIAYAKSMTQQADQALAQGFDVSGQKYLELAAAKGCPVAAAKLKDLVYAKSMFAQALESLAKGHCVSGAKYLELAANKGLVKAQKKQADIAYAKSMMQLAKEYLGMGHKISGKKYVELAAAKGCPCAKELLATL